MLDTETTGLQAKGGDRVVEIGCVELSRYGITDRTYHQLINPEREVPEEVVKVHGLTTERLSTEPKFAEIIDEFSDFVRGARIIIHNAPFDVGFLDEEFRRLNRPVFSEIVSEIVDSLELAKNVHPQMRNTLDALCVRYGIDNSHRTTHGALLDSELLAQVYLILRQQQGSFSLENEEKVEESVGELTIDTSLLKVIRATEDELMLHEKFLDHMEKKGKSNYRKSEEEFQKMRSDEANLLMQAQEKARGITTNL